MLGCGGGQAGLGIRFAKSHEKPNSFLAWEFAMKASVASLVMLLGGLSAANGQTVISVPASGAPIVNGGTYPAGTVYANGMAYPPGTVVQASATATPEVIYSPPGFVTYPEYGVYPYGGVGIGYGYGGWGRGYYGGYRGGLGGGYRGGRR